METKNMKANQTAISERLGMRRKMEATRMTTADEGRAGRRSKKVGSGSARCGMRHLLIATILIVTASFTGGCYNTAAERVIKPVHPGFIGAHGAGQMIERHGPTMRNHWRNTRRAIDNVDNYTPQHSHNRKHRRHQRRGHNHNW